MKAFENVVAREEIRRTVRSRGGVRDLGTLVASVEIVNGTERYSDIRDAKRSFPRMSETGTWCTGEMKTILRITAEALQDAGGSFGEDGTALRFHRAPRDGEWVITIGHQQYPLGFDGKAEFSPEGDRIVALRWRSAVLPARSGLDHLELSVGYGDVEIGGRRINVPVWSAFHVFHTGRSGIIESNVTRFSDYARYGSEVLVSFNR